MRLSILAFAVFASCASLPPQSPRPVSAQERAQALSEVVDVRFGSLGKTPAIDACSVYRFLDGDTAVLERLSTFARAQIPATEFGNCSRDSRRAGDGWYVLRAEFRSDDELHVVASTNEHGGHTETFVLRHGYGDDVRWRVAEVRYTVFWYE
jgi:hypothetical protein